MIWILGIQAALFAGWVTMSVTILFGLARLALQRPAPSGPILQTYLTDPETRLRRRLWLALTVALFLASAVTVGLVSGVLSPVAI